MLSFQTVLLAMCSAMVASAAPIPHTRREVPQEHSHEFYLTSVRDSLNLDNPDGIVDPVFGLLGNGAAAEGAGQITNLDCLHAATADRAFTNAKNINDIQGMVNALIFRALERNTLGVGLRSEACTGFNFANPEVAAVQQHQDAAADGAAAENKEITLELARQIASIGGDPLDALDSGTFQPGDVNDNTFRGNSCNELNDADGCIFTQNLLVEDATIEEIDAAVAGIDGGAGNAGAEDGGDDTGAGEEEDTGADNGGDNNGGANNGGAGNGGAAGNLQQFTGNVGGITAPAVTAGGRGFIVENNDQFLNLAAALGRSCDVHKNQCADRANGGQAPGVSVGDCDTQANACRQLIDGAVAGNNGGANNINNNGANNGGANNSGNTGGANNGGAAVGNLQKFTGNVGGVTAPAVTAGGRGFVVEGSDDFLNVAAAIGRSCDIHKNQCANAANGGRAPGVSVGDCDQQANACRQANGV